MRKAISEAVNSIQSAGFSHIKIELEGQLNRNQDESCDYCLGDGYQECQDCDGEGSIDSGNVVGVNHQVVYEECGDCWGDGVVNCQECEGEGHVYSEWSSEDNCQEYIMNSLSTEAREALTYARFYNDGSVDSEITFTMPADKVEYALEVIEGFKSLANEINYDEDIDVRGSGMHVAVLQSGSYP